MSSPVKEQEKDGVWRKKAVLVGIIVGALAAGIGVFYYMTSKETLASSSRLDEFSTNIDYKVEQYRYRSRAIITFGSSPNSSLVCNLSGIKIDKILEQRWLANGRAIYLNLSINPDSSTTPVPARLIFDFQRGELFLSSPVSLWRTNSSSSRWMNDAEFDGVLARFGR